MAVVLEKPPALTITIQAWVQQFLLKLQKVRRCGNSHHLQFMITFVCQQTLYPGPEPLQSKVMFSEIKK